MQLPATLPCSHILAVLRAEGLPTRLSRDAGDYLCNAALFLALAAPLAPAVGFLHVPHPVAPQSRRTLRPASLPPGVALEALIRAARLALLALAPTANRVAGKPKLGRS